MGSSLLVLSCRARAMQRALAPARRERLQWAAQFFAARKQRGKSTQRTRAFHRLGTLRRCSQGGIRFAAAALVSMCASQLLVRSFTSFFEPPVQRWLCRWSPALACNFRRAFRSSKAAETRDQMASIAARLSSCALGFAAGSVASWKVLNDEIKRTTAVQVAALSAAVPAPPPPPPIIETPAPEPAPAESSSS